MQIPFNYESYLTLFMHFNNANILEDLKLYFTFIGYYFT